MRFDLAEKYRYNGADPFGTKPGNTVGLFRIPNDVGKLLDVVATDATHPIAEGWEHVSVSSSTRTPSWKEMCMIKNLFWNEEEVVVQFHPKKTEYVNNHPHCLHMWRNISAQMPTPPTLLVGIK